MPIDRFTYCWEDFDHEGFVGLFGWATLRRTGISWDDELGISDVKRWGVGCDDSINFQERSVWLAF